MNKFVKAIYKVQHKISLGKKPFPLYCRPAPLFKISHGVRCLYTINLFKKNLTYINSIIPFLTALEDFCWSCFFLFVFFCCF